MIETLLGAVLVVNIVIALFFVASLLRTRTQADGSGQWMREELRAGREESRNAAKELREEIAVSLKSGTDGFLKTLDSIAAVQQQQLDAMALRLREINDSTQKALDIFKKTIDDRIMQLQNANEKKLEEIRKTVDEKLHDSLEKRLGESFRLVSDRLEAVHKGLGEMQHLAAGVGDLKRVLTNVKTRGTWGEFQLGAILEQILAPQQYQKNVAVKRGSRERVEYAIRLPGPKNDPNSCVWLPIDSKFPQEDYIRIQEAAEKVDTKALQEAVDGMVRAIRSAAADIHDKYISPPETTDFAVLFLPTEGLYAEVLRQPILVDELQQKYRVVVAGPATLAALLNSLRMGFQTLAIEQRVSDVWKILGAVKTEFGKFADVLEKVRNQLSSASQTLEKTGVRTRAIEKKLRSVEQLPDNDEVSKILELPDGHISAENGDEQ